MQALPLYQPHEMESKKPQQTQEEPTHPPPTQLRVKELLLIVLALLMPGKNLVASIVPRGHQYLDFLGGK